ncbi:lactate/malate dehydrogenase family protein [Calycomorphotria hydatis]|uniref:L-lactate dehydrogenase 2 n=1 Tax=Calycomorphotria hydatis TaxID=2528027 RepID=A0A517T3F6_9PLAN|nr:lactate/malate dehydrogenase family protein [Calycomorphotria hydatis]QDT62912.1 L-lactate dehydrogenase 2 [Calycomorphotria hydatis]
MKVAIVGGGGLVGSCAAFALQAGGIVREIALVDVNPELAEGQALDLIHGASFLADQTITSGGIEACADSDVVVITAGLRRKPDESRLDLINRNVALFRSILNDIKRVGLNEGAIGFVVSNPVDILTSLMLMDLGLPKERVLGLGTMLDTSRLQGMLANELGVPATQVSALILGEHGDSMVPLWSTAQVAGLPLDKWPGVSPNLLSSVEKKTRGSGAEVIAKKGGAGFAVGVTIAEVIHSIALDRRRTLPVSSLQTGAYGIRDVCLSVPTVVGRAGILGTVEVELWPKERTALSNSANVLKATLAKVLT